MSTPCILVLTARSPERIIKEGGSQAWRLSQRRAKGMEYIVCVQNRHNHTFGDANQPHHVAFMIGRIADVVPSEETDGRYKVVFSEYAIINVPKAWPGLRSPVLYMDLERLGIDPSKLDWQPMPVVSDN